MLRRHTKAGGGKVKGYEVYEEIHKLKNRGYSKRRAAREIDISRDTVNKYWEMSEEEYAEYLIESKTRLKLLDPYRGYIEEQLKKYPEITGSIIHDHLMEGYADFAASARSVRDYVAMLREELGLPRMVKIRQYGEVAELPMGFQAQVDMGEKAMRDFYGKSVKVYIFAMVLSHCRKKFVFFQDHKFNSKEFIFAHDLAFRYFGGRTTEIAYDQDRVLAVSENAGDILYTEEFEKYLRYAGFSVRLCRANDPESKGKIEAVIKYVKNNFLSCREYPGISGLNSDGLAWLERTANEKKHETTKMVPNRVFLEERKQLKTVPTLSEPTLAQTAIVRPTNVVHFRQNRYAVPKGSYFPGRKARIEADEEKGSVTFYDSESGELLASHNIHYGVGKGVGLPKNAERFKETKYEELKVSVMTWFGDIPEASGYIERICDKYPRYIRDQLSIIRKTQELYTKPELERALVYCTERELFSANDFRDTLEFFRRDQPRATVTVKITIPVKYSAVRAEIRPLSTYSLLMAGGEQT
jgi:transposase